MEINTNVENGYIEIINDMSIEQKLKRDGKVIANLSADSSFKDFTIKSGETYRYSLGSATSEPISLDFEYIFLSDSERQLKIKYNSKVSSFKETILEQKVETIGNQYPFVFRNMNVHYKEISISGLISHQTDEANLFNKDLPFAQDTSLSNENYYKERKFREEVIAWLTNGRPKLFRSPQEGNYIIQLMNISLSPMDQLGRLLYSFSATGYEIMEYNIENMLNNNII